MACALDTGVPAGNPDILRKRYAEHLRIAVLYHFHRAIRRGIVDDDDLQRHRRDGTQFVQYSYKVRFAVP